MILVAAWWLAAVHLVAAATLPVSFRFFHPFADRGVGLAVPVGLLAFGLASWWLGVTEAATNGAGTSVAVIGALAVACWGTAGEARREMLAFWRRRRGLLLVVEAVFVGTFLASLWLRSHASDINGTEKFMDFAFLNAVARSDAFPPIDPWMAPSPTMPDPRINYYYFGYLCHGLLIQLTGVAPSEGFNLSLSLVFAMVATGTFSLGYTLARDQAASGGRAASDPGAGSTPLPRGTWAPGAAVPFLVAGGATAAVTLLAGNLYAVVRRLDGTGMAGRDFWTGIGWNATRVLVIKDGDRDVDYTINEFPAFSFLLGDLHPHVLTLPFAVLAVAIAYRWYVDPPLPLRRALGAPEAAHWGASGPRPGRPLVPWRRLVARSSPWLSVVPVAATLGVLYFSNSWDFPTYLGLVLVAGTTGAWRSRPALEDTGPAPRIAAIASLVRVALAGVAIGAVALLAVLPFVTGFTPPVVAAPGDLPVGLVPQRSELGQFLSFWGLHLLWIAPALGLAATILAGGPPRRRAAIVAGGAGLAVAVTVTAGARNLGPYVLAVAMGAIAIGAAARLSGRAGPGQGRAAAFPFICLAVAGALLGACEIVYVRDFYGGALRRMNTVFKLYYQAWLLLGIAAPQLAFWTWSAISAHGIASRGEQAPRVARASRIGLATWWGLVAAAMATYPAHVTGSRMNGFAGPASIDGMDWMRRYHPEDLAASRWLLDHAAEDSRQRAPVVLEATGGAYSEFGRMSTQTGFPTVLGWDQHERLWRGESANAEVERRRQDVERFYAQGSGPEARAVLERYGVAFVVKGYLEEQAYPGPGLDELDDPGSGLVEVFRSGRTAVYATGIAPRSRGTAPLAIQPIRNAR